MDTNIKTLKKTLRRIFHEPAPAHLTPEQIWEQKKTLAAAFRKHRLEESSSVESGAARSIGRCYSADRPLTSPASVTGSAASDSGEETTTFSERSQTWVPAKDPR